MLAGIVLLTILAVFGWFAAMAVKTLGWTVREDPDPLRDVADYLGDARDPKRRHVVGSIDGSAVTYEIVDFESSETRVDCALPPHHPFALHLVRHAPDDAQHIAAGAMTDVVFGDEAFDDRFRVEGAPATIVKRALDPEIRAWLLAQSWVEIHTRDGRVRMLLKGALERIDDARPAIDLLVRLSRNVRLATRAADEEIRPDPAGGAPYRGPIQPRPIDQVQRERAAEVARVDAQPAQRRRRERIEMAKVAGTLVFGLLVLLLLRGVSWR